MNKSRVLVILLAGILAADMATASPTLNYQGRVTADGSNFTGTGYFKFVLVNGSGDGLWSNDGSAGGGEPASPLAMEVNNGLFSAELGLGSPPIPSLAFHEGGLRLRTWFSTDGSVFEQLNPDVEIHPVDFSRLDTGGMIIVASDGKGDFQDIQEAINTYSTDGRYQGILIMPGFYPISAPLTFPNAGREYLIRGVGDANGITIENASGTAAMVGPVRLENITLNGNPALSDASVPTGYQFRSRLCNFGRVSAGGPAIQLGTEGDARFFECKGWNGQGGDVLALSGDVMVTAIHCEFHVWNGSGSALTMASKNRWSLFESCVFDAWQSSAYSLFADGGGNDSAIFRTCDFNRGVVFTNSAYGAEFHGSLLGGGLILEGGGSQFSLNECRIYDGGAGGMAIRIAGVGSDGHIWIRNCDIHTAGNTTFYVKDTDGEIRIKDSEVHSDGGSAIKVVASFGRNGSMLNCFRSRILNYSTTEGTIVILNDPANPTRQVGIDLTDCNVSGEGDALHSEGGTLQMRNCDIQGDQAGCFVSNANVQALSSRIDGGLVLPDAGGEFRNCLISSSHSNTVALTVSANEGRRVTLDACRIESSWNSEAIVGAVLQIVAHPDGWAGIDCRRCEIEGTGAPDGIDGVRCTGGNVELDWSSVMVSRDAVNGTNCVVTMKDSIASGYRHGIVLTGHSGVDIERSTVQASGPTGDGIHLEEDGENIPLHIGGSIVNGSGGCGIYASVTNYSGGFDIIRSTITAGGNAIEFEGGHYLVQNCFVASGGKSAALLKYTGTDASFTGCNFYGMASGNTNSALVLFGTAVTPPPSPKIWNSTVQPIGVPAAPYSVSVAGGATSATVRMVNCILSTNLAPDVAIATVGTTLAGGNVIP